MAYYLKLALQAYLCSQGTKPFHLSSGSHGTKPFHLSSDSKCFSGSQKPLAADTTHFSLLNFHPALTVASARPTFDTAYCGMIGEQSLDLTTAAIIIFIMHDLAISEQTTPRLAHLIRYKNVLEQGLQSQADSAVFVVLHRKKPVTRVAYRITWQRKQNRGYTQLRLSLKSLHCFSVCAGHYPLTILFFVMPVINWRNKIIKRTRHDLC